MVTGGIIRGENILNTVFDTVCYQYVWSGFPGRDGAFNSLIGRKYGEKKLTHGEMFHPNGKLQIWLVPVEIT